MSFIPVSSFLVGKAQRASAALRPSQPTSILWLQCDSLHCRSASVLCHSPVAASLPSANAAKEKDRARPSVVSSDQTALVSWASLPGLGAHAGSVKMLRRGAPSWLPQPQVFLCHFNEQSKALSVPFGSFVHKQLDNPSYALAQMFLKCPILLLCLFRSASRRRLLPHCSLSP